MPLPLTRTLATAAVGALLVAAPTVALADPTGPDTAACEETTGVVELRAETAAVAAVELGDAETDLADAVDDATTAAAVVVDLAVRLAAAIAADTDTDTLAADLAAAEGNLEASLGVLLGAGVDPALTEALIDARAGLVVAVDARAVACADPDVTAPDGDGTDGDADDDGDGVPDTVDGDGFSQLDGPPPVGGVATGA